MLELTLLVVRGPILLCAYAVAVWGLAANLSLTGTFPWSAGPLSNWMIWLVLVLLLHAFTSKFKACVNRLRKNHLHEMARSIYIVHKEHETVCSLVCSATAQAASRSLVNESEYTC